MLNNYAFLKCITVSSKSTWLKNNALQQGRSRPSSSRIFFLSSALLLALYSSQRWPTGLPHEKQRTGIMMLGASWDYFFSFICDAKPIRVALTMY